MSTDSRGMILLEATGVYYEACTLALKKLGWSVSVTLANKAKRYMWTLGLCSKTDHIDAHGLAKMAVSQPLEACNPWMTFTFLCGDLPTSN